MAATQNHSESIAELVQGLYSETHRISDWPGRRGGMNAQERSKEEPRGSAQWLNMRRKEAMMVKDKSFMVGGLSLRDNKRMHLVRT